MPLISKNIHTAVMLNDAGNANNANNGYVATGNKNKKPITMAVERVVVRIKN